MEVLIENLLIYGSVGLLCAVVVFIYLRKQIKASKVVEEKIKIAKEEGLFEPVSLHPVVDPKSCIKSGACIKACPEKDILGIKDGQATTINTSRCIGHGACFHACPVEAITLCIGTEKRGVDLPHVNQHFETNVPGIFIAGELGGMGLIKNAVEQGKQASENIISSLDKNHNATFDMVIVGGGPAGIGAALTARKHNIKFLIVEQDSLGGTVFTFPRSKIVMTSAMNLPLHGKVKFTETNKKELLELWNHVLDKNEISIKQYCKIDSIAKTNGSFALTTKDETFTANKVLLAIGRRGTPRKLNVDGEFSEKVAYRLLEPEDISGKKILVVGGGDSAVESALLLADNNEVILSYRSDAFKRIKPRNKHKIEHAIDDGKVQMMYNTNLKKIEEKSITISDKDGNESLYENDLVYIFAGGELPTQFLEKAGIGISRKFGEAILKH
jgi:thioredoxin reductase (NADPH)